MSKNSVAGRASRADVLPSASALNLDRAPEACPEADVRGWCFNAPQREGVMDAELLGVSNASSCEQVRIPYGLTSN
ncbi:hypothetical protein CDV31_015550 [Fusarium ambrosium]|uniref:Uncharacterized protein n=1 Tax=Fusarium ambrosium TaxID=131363 RepID=A0A428SMV6_9HYPO|nr:hypothetical protein CDV31_015550 [Fusarium ambrosium]